MDSAVSAARSANSPSVTPPYTGPRRARVTQIAAIRPPAITSGTSAAVAREMSEPPLAPNATAAKAAPRATLAAYETERDTPDRRTVLPEGGASAGRGERADADQREQEGERDGVAGVPGVDSLAPDVDRAGAGGGAPERIGQRVHVLGPGCLRLRGRRARARPRGGGGRGQPAGARRPKAARTRPGATARPARAPVASELLEGVLEARAAVRVLVLIRGKVLERLLELVAGVGA